MTRQVSVGGRTRTVPEWAKCYCVQYHRPAYYAPLPYETVDGREIWLCPNTYYEVRALWALYCELDAAPSGADQQQFTMPTRNLCAHMWQTMLQDDREYEKKQEAQRKADLQYLRETDYEAYMDALYGDDEDG